MMHRPYQTVTRARGRQQLGRVGLGIERARSPPSYLAQPTFLHLQLGRAGPGIGRAWSPPSYPTLAHLSALSTWSGGLGHRMGTDSSKLPDPSPLFYVINPDNLSGLELFQEGRTLDSSNEEEEWIAKSSSLDHKVFTVFIEEIPFTEEDASDRVQLEDIFTFARALDDPPMTTSATKLVGSGIHFISD
jgi:hypothetical protein